MSTTVPRAVIGGRRRPLALAAIGHIEATTGCGFSDARLRLQTAMLEREVRSWGPTRSRTAEPIDPEFWRYACPDEDGRAFNFTTLASVDWFEVSAEDVLAIWPNVEVAAVEAAPASLARTKPSQNDVNGWLVEHYRAAREAGKPPPKRDIEAFPACKSALGASDEQMRKAMVQVPDSDKRRRGGRDPQIG